MVKTDRNTELVHTIYTISIRDYSKYEETSDVRFLLKDRNTNIDEMVKDDMSSLVSEISEYFSKREVVRFLNEQTLLVKREIDLNIVRVIRKSLLLGGSEFTRQFFRDKYKKNFRTDEDLKLIDRDIEKKEIRYNEILRKNESTVENNESNTINKMIVYIEELLNVNINRSEELYVLKDYIDRATEKARKLIAKNNE